MPNVHTQYACIRINYTLVQVFSCFHSSMSTVNQFTVWRAAATTNGCATRRHLLCWLCLVCSGWCHALFPYSVRNSFGARNADNNCHAIKFSNIATDLFACRHKCTVSVTLRHFATHCTHVAPRPMQISHLQCLDPKLIDFFGLWFRAKSGNVAVSNQTRRHDLFN